MQAGNPWSEKIPCATETKTHIPQLLSLCAAPTEAHVARARAPQQKQHNQKSVHHKEE